MKPAGWLERVAPGFDLLSSEEREAINDFVLLWSLYEGTILETAGNARMILKTVGDLKNTGRLNIDPFGKAIAYFSERYFDGRHLTEFFGGLRLRPNDQPALVEKVMRGHSADDAEILSAVLIIALRLRNNLFHGIKWSYGIKGQLENFRNASNVLMAAMDLHR